MTETGGGFYTRLDDPPAVIRNTAGRATSACRLVILDQEGQPLPPGGAGELAIRTPFGIQSYRRNPAATEASVHPDGWFLTGDIASIDADGNVRIQGRRKQAINRGGTKFMPQTVEEVILKPPAVRMAVLVGVTDPGLGEKAICFVLPEAGKEAPKLEDLCTLLDRDGWPSSSGRKAWRSWAICL